MTSKVSIGLCAGLPVPITRTGRTQVKLAELGQSRRLGGGADWSQFPDCQFILGGGDGPEQGEVDWSGWWCYDLALGPRFLTPVLYSLTPIQTAQICTANFGCTDPRSPIWVAAALPRGRVRFSLPQVVLQPVPALWWIWGKPAGLPMPTQG